MAILSNVDIERLIEKGDIIIQPYNSDLVQGATLDFRISNKFLVPEYYDGTGSTGIIELGKDFPIKTINKSSINILPQHFILGSTFERLKLPDYLCARVDGKSRIGRKGLIVQTAGHIGPGFDGEITLELFNSNQVPIKIDYKQPICQVEFHELSSISTKPYKGRYLGQSGPKV